MKNLLFYYLAVFVPIIAIFIIVREDMISTNWFIGLFFFYLFVYRTIIDGLRLVKLQLIDQKDIWKLLIPGYRFKYINKLYFNL